MIAENVLIKIENLLIRAPELAMDYGGMARDQDQISRCRGWIAEALNVVENAIPLSTVAYREQMMKIERASVRFGYPQTVGAMAEVLRGLTNDDRDGLLANLDNTITAEAFDTLLENGEEYFSRDRPHEAGVIAGVVFEDTIRKICRNRNISDRGVKLEDLINTLSKQGVITSQQSKQAKVASHVRTKSTHAQWGEFDSFGVRQTIDITRRLLDLLLVHRFRETNQLWGILLTAPHVVVSLGD